MFLNHLSVIKQKIKSGVAYQMRKTTMNAAYENFQEAVNCINNLQSNSSYIQNVAKQGVLPHSVIHSKNIVETQKYLMRTGITSQQLDELSLIHVAGTKGKGSTCAFCESIIRNYGYKTGFYSSPHLVAVRERIKINGRPLSEKMFAENVFRVYNQLLDTRDNEHDMPAYFKFLTILAFNIFIAAKVDVAIVEVGIGGEYDCTNIIRNTPIIGITSLGIDHVSMLGGSLEEIAWHKSGIIKNNSKVFTVQQPDIAMKVIRERNSERNGLLQIVPDFADYIWENNAPKLGIDGAAQKINASLAIQLAHNWIKYCGTSNAINDINDNYSVPDRTKIGLELCKWPGRFQILKIAGHTFYLDGAHTADSLQLCAQWFQNSTGNTKNKALIFNATGARNSEDLLQKLIDINWRNVMFVPNKASENLASKDQTSVEITDEQQIERCEMHKNIWINCENKYLNKQKVEVLSSVEEAIGNLGPDEFHVLITGSLYLVGAALSVLDPELQTF